MQVGANVCTEGGNWNCCKVVPEKHFSQKKDSSLAVLPKLNVYRTVTTVSQEALVTFPDAHKAFGVPHRERIPPFGCPWWQHFLAWYIKKIIIMACLHSAHVVASKTPHFNLTQSSKDNTKTAKKKYTLVPLARCRIHVRSHNHCRFGQHL